MLLKAEKNFLLELFGYEGRELGNPARSFTRAPTDMFKLVKESRSFKRPAYVSVQPYSAADRPCAIEKLFFDFDSLENLDRAWQDTLKLSSTLIQFYGVRPLIVFSGNKGYHVYAFMKEPVQFEPAHIETAKHVYAEMQKLLLKGLNLETLDQGTIGDIKRLARIPFSVNEKSGKMCTPVNLLRQPYVPGGLLGFQVFGLDTCFVKKACENIKERSTLKLQSKPLPLKQGNRIHPKVQELIDKAKQGLNLEHLERVIILAEMVGKGYTDEQIHEVFKGIPDYNEKKTQYFIDYARRKGYKPYSMKKLLEVVKR
jgi:hypothetical protein